MNQKVDSTNQVIQTQSDNNPLLPILAKQDIVNQEAGKIYQTFNYDQFKILNGNRMVHPGHLHRLKKSVEEKQMIIPIIVNEKYEVIDGQHRLEVFKQLNLPVYFIINPGYGIKEIQKLNTHMKNWNVDDYLKCYCGQGIQDYVEYKEFRAKYGFGHQESLAFLMGSTSNFSKIFNDGNLKIKSLEEAEIAAQKVSQFAEFYKGYRRKSFVYAVLSLLKHPEYDHSEMLKKVAMQQRNMVHCTNTEQYLNLLEDIFNFHKRGNRVRFTKS
jgi:hypothetical protein